METKRFFLNDRTRGMPYGRLVAFLLLLNVIVVVVVVISDPKKTNNKNNNRLKNNFYSIKSSVLFGFFILIEVPSKQTKQHIYTHLVSVPPHTRISLIKSYNTTH